MSREGMEDDDGVDVEEFEEGGLSVVTALKWVPRGLLLEKPITYELSKEEKEMLLQEQARMEAGEGGADEDDADMNEDQDEEDVNDDDEEEEKPKKAGKRTREEAAASEQQPAENEEDEDDMDAALPLSQLQDLKLNEDLLDRDDEEEEADMGSDVGDQTYKVSDRVLVTATVEDDQASLEINTYDTETGSFYVHHDIALPAYPLCIEWLGVKGKELNWTETESQSFLAVGSFVPHIEIWSLDVLDALEPNAKLEGHKDAVMCLAWNSAHPHLLASGGADNAVKIWDLQTAQCGRNFNKIHKDKVQSAVWNPAEPTVLLTGSFDRSVCIFDARDSDKIARYNVVDSDVECCVWDVHNPAVFGVATEGGVVTFMDVRLGPSGSPLVSFQAHDDACSSLSCNPKVPGLYATCSADKTVKLWDLKAELLSGAAPASSSSSSKKKSSKKSSSVVLQDKKPVSTRKMKVGKLFACQFAASADLPDVDDEQDPFLLATGGSKGSVALWHAGGVEDDEEDVRFKECFAGRALRSPKVWTSGA